MSERNRPHNGRDRSGHFKVKQADVEELRNDPAGDDYLRDDVRLGGAIADTGIHAGEAGKHIEDLEEENRENVERLRSPYREPGGRAARAKRAKSGQQSGSKRPADRTGSAKRA